MIQKGLNHKEEDAMLHQLIAQSTKNRIIAKLTDTTISFHNQIVDAIERRDERGARSAMMAHISENRLYIIKEIERKKRFV